jgi:hypothetical protein
VILGSRQRKERLYHIDDTPSGVAEVIQDLDRSYEVSTVSTLGPCLLNPQSFLQCTYMHTLSSPPSQLFKDDMDYEFGYIVWFILQSLQHF